MVPENLLCQKAIAIGITGETLRRIKMDEIINDAEDEATVSLLFQNNTTGQYLSIKRVISRKTAQIIKVLYMMMKLIVT